MPENRAHLPRGEIEDAAALSVIDEGAGGARGDKGDEVAAVTQHVAARARPERRIAALGGRGVHPCLFSFYCAFISPR